MQWKWLALGGLLLGWGGAPPRAETVQVDSPAALAGALGAVQPGDRIMIAPGRYDGFHHVGLAGTKDRAILVAGSDPGDPPVFAGQIQLSDPSHVILRDLIVEGSSANGFNIDDGGSFETPAHHLVLQRVTVRDTAAGGNLDGIKLSGVDDFLIFDCELSRWGDGGSGIDMVGCHRGLIRESQLSYTSAGTSSGIQIKGGSEAIVIHRNRFNHAGQRAVNIGGSTGEAFFRPQGADYESRRILVIGNRFLGSLAPLAFVVIRDSVAAYNTVQFPESWLMRILQEKPVPPYQPTGACRVERNLFLWSAGELSTAINIGPNTAPDTFTFAANRWSAVDDVDASTPQLPAPETDGAYGDPPPGVTEGEFYIPPAGSTLAHGADAVAAGDYFEQQGRPLAPWAATMADQLQPGEEARSPLLSY